MMTTERWYHGSRGFGVSLSPGLFHIYGFGWSYEWEWGDEDKGAAWVRRLARRRKSV